MKEKNKKLELLWIDKQTGQKYPAGAAFYHEEKGDYRLKIDAMSDEKLILLKPTTSVGGEVKYRVETVLKKDGKFLRSAPIGYGYSGKETGKYIFMDLGPFSRSLVLDMGS
jgi:hypothetical protein